jgi:hypothetical protein
MTKEQSTYIRNLWDQALVIPVVGGIFAMSESVKIDFHKFFKEYQLDKPFLFTKDLTKNFGRNIIFDQS